MNKRERQHAFNAILMVTVITSMLLGGSALAWTDRGAATNDAAGAFPVTGIKVYLEDQHLSFAVPPQTISGRVMVPMRPIFEAIGATLEWDSATQTATAVKGSTTVITQIGRTIATINGAEKILDVAPAAINGGTLAPLRFVAEAFGYYVKWDGVSQTAYITAAPFVEEGRRLSAEWFIPEDTSKTYCYRVSEHLPVPYTPYDDPYYKFVNVSNNGKTIRFDYVDHNGSSTNGGQKEGYLLYSVNNNGILELSYGWQYARYFEYSVEMTEGECTWPFLASGESRHLAWKESGEGYDSDVHLHQGDVKFIGTEMITIMGQNMEAAKIVKTDTSGYNDFTDTSWYVKGLGLVKWYTETQYSDGQGDVSGELWEIND